jgi:hypothetical protein
MQKEKVPPKVGFWILELGQKLVENPNVRNPNPNFGRNCPKEINLAHKLGVGEK